MGLASIQERYLSLFRETPNQKDPDSLVVRASASGAVGRGFAPRSRHTKGVKNGTSSSLADAHIKKGSARKINEGKYSLLVMSQNSS